jgi:hypothetical protein
LAAHSQEETLVTLATKCDSLDTTGRPAIQRVLIAEPRGLLKNCNDAFTLDQSKFHCEVSTLCIINHQNQIGWNQLFLGRFCWLWRNLQDACYATRRAQGKPSNAILANDGRQPLLPWYQAVESVALPVGLGATA